MTIPTITRREMTWILGIIILLLLAYAGCNYSRYLANQYAEMAKINAGLTNKVKTFTDENGHLHTQLEKLTVDRNAYIETHRQEMDSISKLLGIKSKNITELTTLVTEYKGKLKGKVDTVHRHDTTWIAGKDSFRIDTATYYVFQHKDPWITFNGKIDSGAFTADYSIWDSLTIVEHTKKTGFLGLGVRKNYIDISGTNPNLTIYNTKNVELTKTRQKPWSIGPYVGYGYNGEKWQPSIGVSVQRTLVRF